jgi:ribosomal protein S18 acetylase RimI-like enzyme
MATDFRIQTAILEDIPAIVALVNSAYRGEAARKGWTHEADLISGSERIDEASVKAIIQNPASVILLCLGAEGSLAGSVYLEKQDNVLYLGMLSVSPHLQDQGIGKRLLKAADEYALTHQCDRIKMTVISVRKELINWYERNGYQDTGKREPFPDDGRFGMPAIPLNFMVLEKTISNV